MLSSKNFLIFRFKKHIINKFFSMKILNKLYNTLNINKYFDCFLYIFFAANKYLFILNKSDTKKNSVRNV